MAGKTAVNLNFTAGEEAMAHAISKCGITTILSSRTFLEKAKLSELPGAVFLEDLLATFTPATKALTMLCRAIASRPRSRRRSET